MQNQKTPYAIKEAALIFEAGTGEFFDFIIGVTAPESLRLERVMNRDHDLGWKMYLTTYAKQMDENEKIKPCDFVIVNDGNQPLLPQVLKIHQKLLSKYESMW